MPGGAAQAATDRLSQSPDVHFLPQSLGGSLRAAPSDHPSVLGTTSSMSKAVSEATEDPVAILSQVRGWV